MAKNDSGRGAAPLSLFRAEQPGRAFSPAPPFDRTQKDAHPIIGCAFFFCPDDPMDRSRQKALSRRFPARGGCPMPNSRKDLHAILQ